ncbi:MAG: NAD(P)-dependent oxidoreductase [Chitinispirillaceae bacterium]|nr:NAD(P)-dependent oxidoreductase [Chitinispirillaceae bacterium]
MNEKKKLLVTGASGFLGWNLCRAACGSFLVTGVSLRRPVAVAGVVAQQCDISDLQAVRSLITSVDPGLVIHCAAMANPNECQEQPDASRRINVEASIAVAGICSDAQIPCVYVSTDLVFDGTGPPYSESSTPAPVNTYGEHKLAAERGMAARHSDLLICRVPLMFGDVPPGASSFIQPIISALRAGDEIRLYADEYRTPVSGMTAAEGILLAFEKERGIIHLGGKERISRYGFGLKLANAMAIERPRIRQVLQHEAAQAAPRPPDVSFDSSKAFALGYAPLSIDEELSRLSCLRRIV